ncbi:MAG: Ku protein [Polyangiaceae bacterium]|nr:Ku protein [Polyangiaceae bacterium]
MAARAIGSGTISFGLVSIPFKLYTAASAESVGFNMLHKKCGGRMKQQYLCPTDNEVVERTEMVKGYEFSRDRYVTFTDDEIKKLESVRSGDLELVEFVPASSVDEVYLEKSYYLGPDKGGERAYRLLSESLDRSEKLAVGRYFTRGKEQLVLVRPYQGGLLLHELFYSSEVRAFSDVDTGGAFEFKPIEMELADKLIEQLSSTDFKADKYKDTYGDRVRAAVDQKIAGEEISQAPEAPKAQIIDLLEALKRSLETANDSPRTASPTTPEVEPAEATVEAAASAGKGPKKAAPRAKAEKKQTG